MILTCGLNIFKKLILFEISCIFFSLYIRECYGKECWDIDIKNYASEFKLLEHCTIIRGSLSISLIEHSDPEEFLKFSFPKLRYQFVYITVQKL